MEEDSLSKEEHKEVYALLKRTNKEDPKEEDVRELRKMLTEHPRLWRVGGDLAVQSQNNLLHVNKMTAASREMIVAGLEAMRRNLGYEQSPMLEQMLIEQVLLSWLRLNLYEFQLAELDSKGMTLSRASFWDRRLSAAQMRYLRACTTLARVRKLTRNTPLLQVNIATEKGQQVNIAGDFVRSDDTDRVDAMES